MVASCAWTGLTTALAQPGGCAGRWHSPDVLGYPLVHANSARGRVHPGHPDLLHFVPDAGLTIKAAMQVEDELPGPLFPVLVPACATISLQAGGWRRSGQAPEPW